MGFCGVFFSGYQFFFMHICFMAINQERSQYKYMMFWNLKFYPVSIMHRSILFISPARADVQERALLSKITWKQVEDLKPLRWPSLLASCFPVMLSSTLMYKAWKKANFPFTLKHLKEPQWRENLSHMFRLKNIFQIVNWIIYQSKGIFFSVSGIQMNSPSALIHLKNSI